MSELSIRAQFPQLTRTIHGKPLTYLDSAATSLKPQRVIDRLVRFYSHDYGTVRRGVYLLSQEATNMYEGVRAQLASFIGANDPNSIVFLRGSTEALNLVASSLGQSLQKDDEILITEMEHHANIVPWHFVRQRTGAKLVVAPVKPDGSLDMEAFKERLSSRTKIVSVVHVSNALGTINPVKQIGELARKVGATFIVDGAQSVPHLPVNVQDIDCDFYTMSGHKFYGPTGVGALYGKPDALNALPPFLGGGEMIDKVTFEDITYDDPPHRFEAGTPQIAEVIGMGEAISFLQSIGMDKVAEHDQDLLQYCTEKVLQIPGLTICGTAPQKSGLVAFTIQGMHPFDIGTLLDEQGVCIRVGHHCAQPILKKMGYSATARASFGVYNTHQDVDRFIDGLRTVVDVLA